jgi:hypothetical protein
MEDRLEKILEKVDNDFEVYKDKVIRTLHHSFSQDYNSLIETDICNAMKKYSVGVEIMWYLHIEVENLYTLANEQNDEDAKKILEMIENKNINVISKIYDYHGLNTKIRNAEVACVRKCISPRLQIVLRDNK